MAYTSTDLENIEAAIASGALRVKASDGKEVEYRSMKDLLAARDYVAARLSPNSTLAQVSYARHKQAT